MTAQRYRVGRWGMAEDAEGEWVAFEDFEVVERERDELRREVERLRRVEAAASEIIRYEDSGPPELHDWDAKHEALREALRHDDR